MNIFKVSEAMDSNTYMVGIEDTFYNIILPYRQKGSYNVIAARVLGFSYPDYLRYVRDNYNALLKGKEGYSYAYYKNKEDCHRIVVELNKMWELYEDKILKKLNNGE